MLRFLRSFSKKILHYIIHYILHCFIVLSALERKEEQRNNTKRNHGIVYRMGGSLAFEPAVMELYFFQLSFNSPIWLPFLNIVHLLSLLLYNYHDF